MGRGDKKTKKVKFLKALLVKAVLQDQQNL